MTRSPADITAVIQDMEKEVEAISNQLIDIGYFMNGMTWNECWGLSHVDRKRIVKSLTAKLKAKAGDTTEYM